MVQIIAIIVKCGLKNVHGRELLTILLMLIIENYGLKNVHGRELLTILLVLIMGMLVEVQVEERRFWL